MYDMSTRKDWDTVHMSAVYNLAWASDDPSTKVGCVIVNDNNIQIMSGINGIPRGVKPEDFMFSHVDGEKYKWLEHAERNAFYNATRIGTSVINGTMYLPFLPCIDCARGIVQSGIKRLIVHKAGQAAYMHSKNSGHLTPHSEWLSDSHKATLELFQRVRLGWYSWFDKPLPGVKAWFSDHEYTFERDLGNFMNDIGQEWFADDILNDSPELKILR